DVWAPVHAWRALAQLRAEVAIDPIIRMFRYGDERHDDVMTEDFPKVLAFIGPAAIPPLEAYLNDTGNGDWSRTLATRGLAEMGQRYPDTRDRCVAAMTGPLERFAQNSPNINGFLIGSLLDLQAVESAPVMEKAFAANAVEVMVAGDWEDIEIDLGLLDKRITPRPALGWLTPKLLGTYGSRGNTAPPSGKTHGKARKKKEQKKSRKKNRRK
ncbi:MAG: DUF1186 domain-containing protein, partial [Candidatus Hydrogenedentes bacterium]|nr:DUF1186 domain-containing protein [Candidatus Hydrogenedentota bacterium]